MRIVVNGEPRELEPETTVGQLVERLALAPERLAIELNREVLGRALWPETELAEGDRVEIVHFVGGGDEGFGRPRAPRSDFENPRNVPDVLSLD